MTEPFRHLSGRPHGRVVLSGVLTFCWCCSYWRVFFFTYFRKNFFLSKLVFLEENSITSFPQILTDGAWGRPASGQRWGAAGGVVTGTPWAGEGDLSVPRGGSAPPAGGPQQVRTRPSPAPRPRRFRPELPGEVVDSFVAL